MSVEWSYDSSHLDKDLHKFDDGIPYETILALESALVTLFNATQSATHVITGRLLASGRIDSNTSHDTWEGTITYGGRDHGVVYARFEQRRRGTHDFIAPAVALEPLMDVAFRTGLDD